ncbi:hypothetical protein ACET3Z_003057 [Daucus carota]
MLEGAWEFYRSMEATLAKNIQVVINMVVMVCVLVFAVRAKTFSTYDGTQEIRFSCIEEADDNGRTCIANG